MIIAECVIPASLPELERSESDWRRKPESSVDIDLT
jgi:hypothetical protein